MAKSNARTPRPNRTGTPQRGARKATATRVARTAAPRIERAETDGGDSQATGRKAPAARRSPKLPKAVTGAVNAALDKKAEDVVVLDLKKAGGFTDYFIICTGANPRQIMAIADGVRETLKRDFDERATLAEGIDRSEWILLDYFDFVVHIFSRDCRSFYGLERLWGNAERIEFTPEGSVR
jgi:ribosome-associated protein